VSGTRSGARASKPANAAICAYRAIELGGELGEALAPRGERGRVAAHREPGISVARRAPQRVLAVAADVDRRALRSRQEQERLSVLGDDVARERAVQEVEHRIAAPAALRARHAEGAELGIHPADTHAEAQPPTRELLHRRDRFRGRKRRAIGQFRTPVPSPIREVRPASHASAVSGSR
jgi:hypothetical protein